MAFVKTKQGTGTLRNLRKPLLEWRRLTTALLVHGSRFKMHHSLFQGHLIANQYPKAGPAAGYAAPFIVSRPDSDLTQTSVIKRNSHQASTAIRVIRESCSHISRPRGRMQRGGPENTLHFRSVRELGDNARAPTDIGRLPQCNDDILIFV